VPGGNCRVAFGGLAAKAITSFQAVVFTSTGVCPVDVTAHSYNLSIGTESGSRCEGKRNFSGN